MDVLALRTAVETTLVDFLGDYLLPNGQRTPAVAVRSAGEKLPADWRVTGLECVIHREPMPFPLRQYSGQVAFNVWILDLMAWSVSVELQDVTARVLAKWPGSSFNEMALRKNEGPLAARRVVLQENRVGG